MSYPGVERALARLTSFFIRKPVRDDDVVDRLHHNASLILLLIFAAGTAVQEYVGQPINCWTPSSFPQDHYTQHVNEYCWTHALRYPTSSLEAGVSGDEARQLLNQRRLVNFGTAFYRWVTLIFVLQAALFKLPNVVWTYLNRQSGASLTQLRDLLTEAQLSREERHSRMDQAAQYLHSWLAAYRTPAPRKMLGREIRRQVPAHLARHLLATTKVANSKLHEYCRPEGSGRSGKLSCLLQGCGRRSGKYLCVVYLGVKGLYLLNVLGNFVLLSVFLDAAFWRYGITVLNQVIVNGDWSDPINFPRLLICDFRLHHSDTGTTDSSSSAADEDSTVHAVQCVLSINMILEKLFVLQWFWLVILAVLTLATSVKWALNTVCPCAPYFFARVYMKALMYRSAGADDSKSGQRFVRDYLREDGAFLLRMAEANTGRMVVKELVQHLWDIFHARDVMVSKEMAKEMEIMIEDEVHGEEEEEEDEEDEANKEERGGVDTSFDQSADEHVEMGMLNDNTNASETRNDIDEASEVKAETGKNRTQNDTHKQEETRA